VSGRYNESIKYMLMSMDRRSGCCAGRVLELVGCGRQRLIAIRYSRARLALMLKRYGIHGEKERDRCADGK
jgi:hypothetical protein